jgi:histidyl-tRNA synthetase
MNKKQKAKQFQRPRGMHDILPQEAAYWDTVEKISKNLSSFYGFQKIETPHIEQTELFQYGVGNTTDVVEKQMYSFKTRGGDHVTLRPEGTAPIVRAYIENGMIAESQPVKLWYFGSFFRHESPQRGRFREFHQWGMESLGEEGPVIEAEIIQIMHVFFKELGLQDVYVELNSIGCSDCRSQIKSHILAYYRSRSKKLCVDCRRRMKENYLRLFDCKEEKCMQIRQHAPQILEHICERCKTHFTALLEFMDEAGVSYILNPYLVRGLDYYTRTVFEFFVGKPDSILTELKNKEKKADNSPDNQSQEDHASKAHNAIASGGRYDGLAEMLGGRPTPAAGGAVGIERVIEVMHQQKVKPAEPKPIKLFLVQLGDLAKRKSLKIMEQFRKESIPLKASLSKDSIKSQFTLAAKHGAEYVLIFGQKEALDGEIIIREMTSGIQETVSLEKLVDAVKRRLK